MGAVAGNEHLSGGTLPIVREPDMPEKRVISPCCTGCGSARLRAVFEIRDQPVVSNYRFPSARRAVGIRRGDIELVRCGACGLVFNAAFDASAVPYDRAYENQQDFSATFDRHATDVALWIAGKIRGRSPHVLEIGCGKGVFLRRLVGITRGRGTGYDTSYEKTRETFPNISIRREYLRPQRVNEAADAIVVRHVVEHIGPIGSFLADLAEIARRSGGPPVFVETPRLEWIVRTRSAWDIFYEHCNYFTEASLESLCRKAGFYVRARRRVFGGQYQLLELRLSSAPKRRYAGPDGTRISMHALRRLGPSAWRRQAAQIDRLRRGGPWVLWGAGAKGVCIANRLPVELPAKVIDINPAKQGSFVPGAAVPVVAPSARALSGVKLVVIANPSYRFEIKKALRGFAYAGRIHVLSENRS